MRPPARFSLLFILLAAGACAGQKSGSKSAADAETPTEEAKAAGIDVEALLAKELDPQATHAVAAADGSFKATLEATTPPQVTAGDGFTQIAAPLGEYPLMCFVYAGAKDAGEVIRVMVENTLAKAAPKHEFVDVRGDQVEGWGYVAARAHYLVDSPQGKVVGDFKIAASVKSETTVMCLLDAPGLYGTFERSLRGFLGSLQVKKAKKQPKPSEASITRGQMAGRLVTISRSYETKQGRGKVVNKFSTSLAIGAEGTLSTSDDASTETFTKGALESGTYASQSGGRMQYSLQLKKESKSYKVAGTFQDKPLAAEFPAEAGFLDDDRESAEMCKVRSGKAPQVTLVDYSPDVDPLHPSSTLIEKNGTPDGDLKARLVGSEGSELLMRLDDKCDLAGGTMKLGPVSMEIERLWHEKPRATPAAVATAPKS
jgi:hypothetical protein